MMFPNDNSWRRGAVAAVFVLAVAWSGFYVRHAGYARRPMAVEEEPAIAIHLAHRHGFLSPYQTGAGAPLSAWSPPVYPYLISKVMRHLGDDAPRTRAALLGFNVLLYAAAAAGLFAAALRLFGWPAAACGVGLYLLNPFVLRWTGYEWDTFLALAMFVWVMVWAFHLRRGDHPGAVRPLAFTAFGAALGLLCLTNPAYVLGAAALLAIAAWGEAWAVVATRITAAAIAAAVVLAPWTVRNYAAFDRLVFVRTNAPFETWFGNRTGTTGWLTIHAFEDGHPARDSRQRALVLRKGEGRYADLYTDRFVAEVRAAPLAYIGRCACRAAGLFLGDPTQPSFAPGVPKGRTHGVAWGTFAFRAGFALLGLAGVWLGWRLQLRTPWVVGPALLSVAPFVVSSVWDKQVVPLAALLCVPGGLLVAGVVQYLARGEWPSEPTDPIEVATDAAPARSASRVRAWWASPAGVPAFNRWCLRAGAVWLGVSIPLGIILRPTVPDFGQFFTGAQVLRHGAWDSLYPIARADSMMNPGLKGDSDARPAWHSLEQQYGVPAVTRWILPPPSVLVFAPLALFSFNVGFWIFTAASTICVVAVGCHAARSLRTLAGRETRWEGALILLVTFSPMTARAIRIANTTPFIAVLIGLIVFGLLHRESRQRAARVGAYILVGALMKYATLVLLPLLLLTRRWRTLAVTAVLAAIVTGATLALGGAGPFVTFRRDVAPLLDRIPFFMGNQSIPGYLARIHDADSRLPHDYQVALAVGRFGVLAMVLGLIALRRREDWRRPEMLFAAATALVSWMMLYGPIMWEHYPIFTAPFWGWLLWEAMRRPSPAYRWVTLACLVLVNVPQGIFHVQGILFHPFRLPEALNCTQTYAVLMMLGLATVRLGEPVPWRARVTASAAVGRDALAQPDALVPAM